MLAIKLFQRLDSRLEILPVHIVQLLLIKRCGRNDWLFLDLGRSEQGATGQNRRHQSNRQEPGGPAGETTKSFNCHELPRLSYENRTACGLFSK